MSERILREQLFGKPSEETLSQIFETDPERMTGRCKDCAMWSRRSVAGEPMDYGQCTLVIDWHQTPAERGQLRKPLIHLNADLDHEPHLITPEDYGCVEFEPND